MLLLEGHTSAVQALAFSPDGRFLASGTRDGQVWLWDPSGTHRELFRQNLDQPQPINAVDFHPDGNRLAIGGRIGWLYLKVESDKTDLLQMGSVGGVTAIRFLGPDLVAVGRGDRAKQEPGGFEIQDLTTSQRREPYFPAPLGVRAVAVVPHRKRVAWSEWGRKLALWDITKPDAASVGLNQNGLALAFDPDGTHLAVALGWEVHTLDADKRHWRSVLKGHKGIVQSVAFSPDGRILASGSWDGTVRFWDPHTGIERTAFQWPTGRVYSLAFSPDGLRVAAAGETGTIVVWDAV